jgi:predicted AAA+ superfamily ATPase
VVRRNSIPSALNNALARSRLVSAVGPRQSGKTSLARELLDENSINLDRQVDAVPLEALSKGERFLINFE